VRTDTDHDNCGACGRNCREGECQDGECQASNLVSVPPTSMPPAIALDASALYWTSGATISSYHLTTRAKATIATVEGPVQHLVVRDGFIYFVQQSCPDTCLRRVAVAPGSLPDPPLFELGHWVYGFLATATEIYWFDKSNGGSVLRWPIAMSQSPHPDVVASNQGEPTGLAVDDQYVYWGSRRTGDGIIKRARLDGTSPVPEHLVVGLKAVDSIAVDGQNVYWTDPVTHTVEMAPKRAGAEATVLATMAINPTAIAVHGTDVYWANMYGEDGLHRYSLCTKQRHEAADVLRVWNILLQDGYLYFNHSDDFQSAGVRRFAP
jgi:hypothetical protein